MQRILSTALLLLSLNVLAQGEKKVNASLYDGFAVIGYVDQGGFLNFTGPNINAEYGNSKFVLGMLPSLRFKQDKGTPRNSFITPNLGIGLTYSYKYYAIQIPFYYNPKTATANGQWYVGVGIGVRLNAFN